MKNLLLILLFFATIFLTEAQSQRQVKMWLKKCDVQYCIKEVSGNKVPKYYWNQLYINEKTRWYWSLNQYKPEAEALSQEVDRLELELASYYKNHILRDSVVLKWCDWQTIRLVDNYKYGNMLVVVSDDNEPNACTTPNGLIILNKGLVTLLTDDEVLAVLAHEYAHYLLNHTFVEGLKKAKKTKRNRVWSEIATGILAGSDAYYNSVSTGNYRINRDYNQWRDAFYTEISYNSLKRSFYHSRQQEMQADLAAYRFMEWIGVGGNHLLSALSKLAQKVPDTDSKWNDHPSFRLRLAVLSYLIEHEH